VKHIYSTGITYNHHLRSSKYFYNTGSLFKIFFQIIGQWKQRSGRTLAHLPKVEGSNLATTGGTKNVIKNVVKIE
jgi:hypothetical protein